MGARALREKFVPVLSDSKLFKIVATREPGHTAKREGAPSRHDDHGIEKGNTRARAVGDLHANPLITVLGRTLDGDRQVFVFEQRRGGAKTVRKFWQFRPNRDLQETDLADIANHLVDHIARVTVGARKNPMIAAIYARKSTDQQLPDAEKSVTRQVEHATAYAARKGWTVDPAHVYLDDGISGAEFERRAGLTALLAALRPRPAFDVVIMAEPSRLGREQIETAYTLKRITDAGVAVWYYLDDRRAAMDSALAKVMASLSGFASESEREQAARGPTTRWPGRRRRATSPGDWSTGTTTIAPGRPRRAPDPRARGRRGAAHLRALRERDRPPHDREDVDGRGGAAADTPPTRPSPGWGPAALREILRRELYRGEVVWNRRKKTDRGGRTKVRVIRPETDLVRVTDERLRIVDDDLWQRCQARRAELAATKPAGTWTRSARVARPALLSGLGRCGVCGSGLVRATRAHGSARQRRHVSMYACGRTSRGLPCANRVALEEATVDAAILEALAKALARQTLDAALDLALEELRAERASGQAQRHALERELAQIATRQERLAVAIAQGTP